MLGFIAFNPTYGPTNTNEPKEVAPLSQIIYLCFYPCVRFFTWNDLISFARKSNVKQINSTIKVIKVSIDMANRP